jgi:hypothetical protein
MEAGFSRYCLTKIEPKLLCVCPDKFRVWGLLRMHYNGPAIKWVIQL